MIIGSKEIDYVKIKNLCAKPEELLQYCDSLVPAELRHQHAIVMNQRYYVALSIRQIKTLPYIVKKSASEYLLKEVSVTGVINVVYDYNDLLQHCDIVKLEKALKGGLLVD